MKPLFEKPCLKRTIQYGGTSTHTAADDISKDTAMLLPIAAWIICGFIMIVSQSQEIQLEIDHVNRVLDFFYPRDGDTLLLTCNEVDVCNGDIVVAGYFKDKLSLPPRTYVLHFKIFSVESTITAHGTGPAFGLNIKVMVKNAIVVPFSFRVEDLTSGLIIYSSAEMKLLAVHPSDYGVKLASITPVLQPFNGIVDFIELGTSNFDTATQAAAALLATGAVTSIRGIAVDAVIQYLAALPKLEGCHRINAGITTSESEQLLPVFYLPESIVAKVLLIKLVFLVE